MNAACASHPELDWHEPADYPRTAAICGTCPEAAACQAGARARGETAGMWGGWVADLDTTDHPATSVALEMHGLRATYSACRDGSDGRACQACTAANRRYVARWRSQRATCHTDLTVVVRELHAPLGKGRLRAFPGQLYFPLGEIA